MDEPLLVGVTEAAKILGIGRDRAYDLVATGEIASIRLGRLLKIPRQGLDAWVERAAGLDHANSNGAARP